MMDPVSDKLTPKQKTAVMGLMLGSAIDNKQLIRMSLTEIIKDKDIKPEVMEGLIAVLLGDIEAEDSIKSFCS